MVVSKVLFARAYQDQLWSKLPPKVRLTKPKMKNIPAIYRYAGANQQSEVNACFTKNLLVSFYLANIEITLSNLGTK